MQLQIQLFFFWKDTYLWILGFVQLKYDEIMNIHESISWLPGFLLFALWLWAYVSQVADITTLARSHHWWRGQSLTGSSCTAACSQSLVAFVGDAQRATFFLLYLASFLRSTYSYLDHWTRYCDVYDSWYAQVSSLTRWQDTKAWFALGFLGVRFSLPFILSSCLNRRLPEQKDQARYIPQGSGNVNAATQQTFRKLRELQPFMGNFWFENQGQFHDEFPKHRHLL